MKIAAALCLCVLSLSACESAGVGNFSSCVQSLKTSARDEAHVSAEVFDQFVTGVIYEPALAEPGPPPPEFVNTTWEYASFLVDDARVAQGREVLATWKMELDYIQAETGVDPATVVAFFGIETDFGRFNGRFPVISTLVNRACGPVTATAAAKSRARRQLYAAIEVLRLGDVKPEEFRGSYAGAFGLTQFIPATYLAYRGKPGQPLADGDRDGKVDVMHSIPDALMLTALKVKADGWTPGLPWALAAALPASFDKNLILREKAFGGSLYLQSSSALLGANRRTLADWQSLGVSVVPAFQPAVQSTDEPEPATPDPPDPPKRYPALTPQTPFVLLSLNDDAPGPYILASADFEAHYRYNFSVNYAFAVGLLADRLNERPALPLQWASDDRGLSRAEIRELQCRLTSSHPEVRADGLPGAKTRLAITAEETRLGRVATGRTTLSLLDALRSETPAAPDCL